MLQASGPYLPINVDAFDNAIRVMKDVVKSERMFNIGHWLMDGGHNSAGWILDRSIEEAQQCGTSACIIGWCAFDPWFREQGLWFKGAGIYMNPVYEPYRLKGCTPEPALHIAALFGITQSAAYALFFPEGYKQMPSARVVINKLTKARDTYQTYRHSDRDTYDIRRVNPFYGLASSLCGAS